MRCELMQMQRMAAEERFGEQSAQAMRRVEDMRRRMRQERKQVEEEHEYDAVSD